MEILDYIANFFHYALSFIIIISIVVFIHEWGHFIVARIFGVKVDEFSIGFGKELFGWNDKKETRWKVCLLPLGGFVKMHGDADGASTKDEEALNKMSKAEKKISFHFKPLWQKALIVFAGPAINYILAIFIFTSLYTINGQDIVEHSTKIGTVIDGGVADELGMQSGDRILSIGGEEVKYFSEIAKKTMLSPSVETKIAYERDGEVITKSFVPATEYLKNEDGKYVQVRLGVTNVPTDIAKKETIEMNLAEALSAAITAVYEQSAQMLKGLGQVITGNRSIKEMGGPVKIAEYTGQFTENISKSLSCFMGFETDKPEEVTCNQLLKGGFIQALLFTAMISTMLGLVNLFPIPMLDGGHLAFYAIEAITRRPMAEKYQEYAFKAGFVFLISLMVYVTYNDVVSFVQRHFL